MSILQAIKEVELIDLAIKTVKECADQEKKLYHSKHINAHYRDALERLEVKRVGAYANLSRYNI